MTEKLLKLYRIDEQLKSLKSRLQAAQRYYNAQSAKVKALEEQLKSPDEERKHLAAAAANFENEAKTIEKRMDTLRERMSSSKTNKEYTAFLTELNTIKLDKDEAESKALEHMSQAEEIEERVTEVKSQITERIGVQKIARKEFEERKEAVADRLAELENERLEALKGIPEATLAQYEEQLDWNDGQAMAPVIEQDRRNMEYACGACHMSIPIERLSSLLSRGDLTLCPSCHRILYVENEIREVFDKKLAKH